MATTETQLQEARDALHKLNLGKQVVKVEVNGRSTTFAQADRAGLESYVKQLESQLAIANNTTTGRRRPIQFRG